MQLYNWNEQRINVFNDRYALKDQKGNLLESSPAQMFKRIAHKIGDTQIHKSIFEEILNKLIFVPSGRILSDSSTLYNCFVLGMKPPQDQYGIGRDSRQSIMSTVSRMIEITARGGGVGINWSTLRPKDTYIKGVQGYSSGATSWMAGADAMADSIRQGGSRTAALMFALGVWHPDIYDFINMDFSHANFSVAITDEFMQAVEDGKMHKLEFPDTTDPRYNSHWDGDLELWKSLGGKTIVYREVNARVLWGEIVNRAHQTGNPGLIFLDRANKLSNTWYLDKAVCTNPCGEQPLPPNGCCNLGAVNLLALADGNGMIEYTDLKEAVYTSVRFLDNVIDISAMITPEIQRAQMTTRRVGLGTMGLADVFILNGIRYGSERSLAYIDDIYSKIRDYAYMASVELAKEKGPAPGYDKEFLRGEFIKTLPEEIQDNIRIYGIRNLALLTQAPTGTTSVLAGASSGIEPIFSASYIREDVIGKSLIRHPLFEQEGIDKNALVVANDLTPREHLIVQARIQQYLDSSISKTINLSKESTPSDVAYAYMSAYVLGCKGITVYRDGCRGENVLTPYCETCNI